MSERKSLRPPNHRASMATAGVQRLKPTPNDKSSRASIATSSPTKSTYAQKTQSSNSRLTQDPPEPETNISVYVRCRSRNDREIKENSGVVVSTTGHNGKEVILQTGPMAVSNKTYTFDRVFGAESDQEMVYDGIAKGVLQEMLQGYNCTVFAYGQTGTGKTYTMSGDIQMAGHRLSENSGIIPRTLVDLFKSLEKNPDFSVKISFIELYNEELKDLLLTNEPEERKVRIFEDPNKKTIMVQGMEEIYIKTAAEGMKVLSDGSYNRQVASTKCNDLSSRSHSVFTITVHMKEIDPISGEEYLKIGKLNLVDLAGSENISRSGAENKRAREAGMINQSLLTLGRVINALVDQSSHIPYRESKLTRLLQDSLGGKTKTCIIATISPAKVSLEETISTLEYANRAKSIKNKPQVNQSMSKKMLIKEYVEEIERLRNDLNATRNRNGIYVTEENMEKITAESESRRILVEEQKLRMSVLEEQLRKLKKDLEGQLKRLAEAEESMAVMKEEKEAAAEDLRKTKDDLYHVQCELRLEHYVSKNSENVTNEVSQLYISLNRTLQDVIHAKEELHNMIDTKTDLETHNQEYLKGSKQEITTHTKTIADDIARLSKDNSVLGHDLSENFNVMVQNQQNKIKKKCTEIDSFGEKLQEQIKQSISKVIEKSEGMSLGIDEIETVKKDITDVVLQNLGQLREITHTSTSDTISGLECIGKEVKTMYEAFDTEIQKTLSTVQQQISAQTEEVVTLSGKLLQYQVKYQQQLEQEVKRLELFKQEEMERSETEQTKLVNDLSSLMKQYESARNDRFMKSIDAITPAIRSVGQRQVSSGDKFSSFINEGWKVTQNMFVGQLQTQSENLHKRFESASHDFTTNHIQNSITHLGQKQTAYDQSIGKSVEELGSKMVAIDRFTESLKTLNVENLGLSKSQFQDISSKTQMSFGAITETFEKLGTSLAQAKPQLVDSYLKKQEQFVESFKTATLSNIANLESYVQSMEYETDDVQAPKRQKITTDTKLPRTQTRDQILEAHRNEIYPARSTVEKSMMIPIPDKVFKQPLGELTTNVNLKRDETERQKIKSRPGSAASTRSAE